MSARPSSLAQQRCESLHPAIDGDVVDLDAPFGEQLLDVAVGEAKAQVPVDRQDDDVGWEAEADEVRPWNRSRARTARSYAASLAAPQRSQRTQQRLRSWGPRDRTAGLDATCRVVEASSHLCRRSATR
jgi:hypothetical protein